MSLRTENEVRSYDRFKLTVLLILVALLALTVCSALQLAAPPAPAAAPAESSPPTLVPPAPPSVSAESQEGRLALTGSGAPGSTVQIVIDGAVAGAAIVDGQGAWSFDTKASAGAHIVVAQRLGDDGRVAASSPALNVVVAAAIAAPTVDPPVPGAGSLSLTGRGAPGSTLQVTIDGKLTSTIAVGADGAWSFDADVDPGEHDILVSALDADGRVAASAEAVKIAIAEPVVAPAIDAPASTISPLALGGSGKPGATVQIVVDGVVAGAAAVGADGKWSFTLNLAPGDHEILARSAGAESAPLAIAVVAPAMLPAAGGCSATPGVNRGDTYVVGACETLSHISRSAGVDLRALIAANPQIRNPDLIYPGQVLALPR